MSQRTYDILACTLSRKGLYAYAARGEGQWSDRFQSIIELGSKATSKPPSTTPTKSERAMTMRSHRPLANSAWQRGCADNARGKIPGQGSRVDELTLRINAANNVEQQPQAQLEAPPPWIVNNHYHNNRGEAHTESN